MARPITFLSDYGLEDDFVGVCHAVMARIAPEARVIDLTHGLARHDVRSAAMVLRRSLPETLEPGARKEGGAGSILRLLREHPRAFFTVVGFTAGGSLIFYTFTTYMQKYLVNTAHMEARVANVVMTGALFVYMCLQPPFGMLSDHIGRRHAMLIFGALAPLLSDEQTRIIGAQRIFERIGEALLQRLVDAFARPFRLDEKGVGPGRERNVAGCPRPEGDEPVGVDRLLDRLRGRFHIGGDAPFEPRGGEDGRKAFERQPGARERQALLGAAVRIFDEGVQPGDELDDGGIARQHDLS